MKENKKNGMMKLNEEQLEAVTGGDFLENLKYYRIWENMMEYVFGDMLEEYDRQFQ